MGGKHTCRETDSIIANNRALLTKYYKYLCDIFIPYKWLTGSLDRQCVTTPLGNACSKCGHRPGFYVCMYVHMYICVSRGLCPGLD